MTVIKWEFPKGALCLENDKQTPSCDTNPKQVTHEGSHYRISTTDREFVSCVVCLRMTQLDYDNSVHTRYTAISRKVVEKSARDNPERYCGWFLVHCFRRNFKQWQERPWTYVCECLRFDQSQRALYKTEAITKRKEYITSKWSSNLRALPASQSYPNLLSWITSTGGRALMHMRFTVVRWKVRFKVP